MTARVQPEALAAARLGAGWAFEAIYGVLAGHVRRFLAAQGAPDPDATTQEVFVRVLRNLDRFDGDAEQLRSWVFTVARNRLVDERRAAARRPVAAPEAPPDLPAPGGEDDVVSGLEARRLLRILDDLQADQREVVVLRFLAAQPGAGRGLPVRRPRGDRPDHRPAGGQPGDDGGADDGRHPHHRGIAPRPHHDGCAGSGRSAHDGPGVPQLRRPGVR